MLDSVSGLLCTLPTPMGAAEWSTDITPSERDTLARAMAAAGVLSGMAPAHWRLDRDEPLRTALAAPPARWRPTFPNLRPGASETLELAERWLRARSSAREADIKVRLELSIPVAQRPIDAWLALLSHDAVGADGVYALRRRASRRPVIWERTPSIGLLPDTAENLTEALAEAGLDYMIMTAEAPEVDLLLLSGHEHPTRLAQLGRSVEASWALALNATELDQAGRAGSVAGRVATRVPQEAQGSFLRSTLNRLAHAPLDVALRDAARELGVDPPLIEAERDAVAATDPELADIHGSAGYPDVMMGHSGTARYSFPDELRASWDAPGGRLDVEASRSMGREPEAKPVPPTARFVQAAFRSPGGTMEEPEPARLEPGGRADLLVMIGPRRVGWAAADEPLPEPITPVARTFDVVLVLPTVLDAPDTRTVTLPPDGASDAVRFPLAFPTTDVPHEGRIIVLHRGRVVQTLGVSLDLGIEKGPEARVSIEQETLLRLSLTSLDADRRPFDAAFVANHSSAGLPGVAVIPREGVPITATTEWQAPARRALDLLETIVHDGPESDFRARIADLARTGAQLRLALAPDVGELPAGVPALQVVSARSDAWLPVELLYDGPLPLAHAPSLCARGKELLREHEHGTACDSPHDDETICPLGFWGLRMVIERQVDTPAFQDDQSVEWRMRAEPTAERQVLSTAACSVLAVHRDVDTMRHGGITEVEQALARAGSPDPAVWSWPDWRKRIAEREPGLLVVLAHTATPSHRSQTVSSFTARGPMRLEITHGSLPVVNVDETYVRSSAEQSAPIVVLAGCRTAAPLEIDQSFAAAFRRAGAPVVVATLTHVLGRHAAPVTREIIDQLADPTNHGRSVGEVLLRIRRRTFAENRPLALTLVAYGDADWKLTTTGPLPLPEEI